MRTSFRMNSLWDSSCAPMGPTSTVNANHAYMEPASSTARNRAPWKPRLRRRRVTADVFLPAGCRGCSILDQGGQAPQAQCAVDPGCFRDARATLRVLHWVGGWLSCHSNGVMVPVHLRESCIQYTSPRFQWAPPPLPLSCLSRLIRGTGWWIVLSLSGMLFGGKWVHQGLGLGRRGARSSVKHPLISAIVSCCAVPVICLCS